MWNSWLLLFALSSGLVLLVFGDEPFCFHTGNCYTVSTTLLPFNIANMTCGSGGSLASMKTQQEHMEILNFTTHVQKQRNISSFWLGLYAPVCISSVKDLYGFVWVSGGDRTEVSRWNIIPKPSCSSNKKCVMLEYNKSNSNRPSNETLEWRAIRCQKKLPSICRSSKSRHISATKDLEIVTQPASDPYKTHTLLTDQYTAYASHTEMPSFTSQINVPSETFWKNMTSTCKVTISYACNATDCLCRNANDNRVVSKQRKWKEVMNMDCLQECIKSMNISCSCDDVYTPCEGEECTSALTGSPESPVSPSTDLHSASSTPVPPGEDDLLERLIIPLILGLVAFGILVMLVWGGVQMCIRRRKPKRRKSIAPAPPEGSDTDSTDHSSSDEEDDEDEEGESQDRTEEP